MKRYKPQKHSHKWRVKDALVERGEAFGFRAKLYDTKEECQERCDTLNSNEKRFFGTVRAVPKNKQ